MKGILSILLRSLKPEAEAVRAALMRVAVFLFVLCVSAIIAAVGLGFVVWSSYLYLETVFSPYIAALISGGAAVVIALLLVLFGGLFAGFFKGGAGAEFTSASPLAGRFPEAEAFIKQHPLESGLIAAVAGFIAGSSSATPRTLTEIILLLKESASE